MSVDELADSLELLADVANAFCTRDATRVRALRESGTLLDRGAWERIARNGWFEILVPERLGGAELGLDAVAIVARALGYAAFPEPFVAAGVLAPSVLSSAIEAGAEAPLDEVLEGRTVVGVAWHGDVVSDEQGRLTGESRFTGVGGADGYVVAGRSASGASLLWTQADAPGVRVREERQADGSFSGAITLSGATGMLLVEAPHGGDILQSALDVARVAVSAELLGIADAALGLTLDYLRQRKQFGRPIGTFQALQHRAVDMWMARELTSAAVDAAVSVYANPRADVRARSIAATSAKARAALAVPQVCKSALQLHGAIGFTDEYDLGLYLNRALTLAPWLGNATEQRRRYVELMLGSDEGKRGQG
jgi:alkylation response protein AidB-like acyl-CoA dehydrogenase